MLTSGEQVLISKHGTLYTFLDFAWAPCHQRAFIKCLIHLHIEKQFKLGPWLSEWGYLTPENNVRLTFQCLIWSLRSMSAGINQSHRSLSPTRDPTYTQACFTGPSSDSSIHSPYFIDKANWTQSIALDTSKNFKSTQCVTRMMDCIYTVQSFHCVEHFNSAQHGGGGLWDCLSACQLVSDCIQTISKLNSHLCMCNYKCTATIMSQQLVHSLKRSKLCIRFLSSHP